jgi:hypothetical protein
MIINFQKNSKKMICTKCIKRGLRESNEEDEEAKPNEEAKREESNETST